MSGQVSYLAGKAAEEIVARYYADQGYSELQRRWRGPGGEVDLILAGPEQTVFVEVKKSRDFETAAARITPRQIGRVQASAAAYLGKLEAGLNSEARIDVALVDAQGCVELVENVTMH